MVGPKAIDQRLPIDRVRNVRPHTSNFAGRGKAGDRRPQLILPFADKNGRPAPLENVFRRGLADAAGAADDDQLPAFEIHRHPASPPSNAVGFGVPLCQLTPSEPCGLNGPCSKLVRRPPLKLPGLICRLMANRKFQTPFLARINGSAMVAGGQ